MSKEVKIGLTGIVALVIMYLGVNFLKGIKTFSNRDVYYISFSNTKGLTKSSPVYADGFKVGIVSGIKYDYSTPGNVVVEINTDETLRIPKGSSAELDEAILGGCKLNLLLATNPREAFQPGDTIIGSDAMSVMSKAGNMMPQIESVVAKVDTLITALNALVSNPNLPIILEQAAVVSQNLNRSSAQLNQILGKDVPQLTHTYTVAGENISQLSANLNQLNFQATLDSVNQTLSSVHAMMAAMQSQEGTIGKMMKDPSLYDNLNHTVQSADSLVNDLKSNPKRYVHFSVFGRKQ